MTPETHRILDSLTSEERRLYRALGGELSFRVPLREQFRWHHPADLRRRWRELARVSKREAGELQRGAA